MINRVLIMAGGTGGHVFPGLAVAKLLRERNINVAWLGSSRGLEAQKIPLSGIKFFRISISGWRGKGIMRFLLAPFRVLKAFFKALWIISIFKPDVVLGMGGFVSGPGGIACRLLRKRLIIHEQNALPGLTNKILSRFAERALTGFPNTGFMPRILYVGNPVRREIAAVSTPEKRLINRSGRMRLLIVGGSQGAKDFNQIIPEAVRLFYDTMQPIIWHQTGAHYLEETRSSYQSFTKDARVESFIENMADAYSWADLAVCRAGALTVAELSAVGLGSILVPYPYSADDHQTVNARFLANADAAILLPHGEFTKEKLKELLVDLMSNRKRLLRMAKSAKKCFKSGAAERVVGVLCNE